MNGRIYDPLLGRFLSADLMVPHPGSLQSYNRYSYVQNNPLTLVDPTGFFDYFAGEDDAWRKHNQAVDNWIWGTGDPPTHDWGSDSTKSSTAASSGANRAQATATPATANLTGVKPVDGAVIDAAQAADGVYPDSREHVPTGYHRAAEAELSALGATKAMLEQMKQLNIDVYINPSNGNAIVSYRGTFSIKDYGTDAANAIGFKTAQYGGAIKFATEFKRNITPNLTGSVTLTGHSLGGGEAAAGALAPGYKAITFNAAGVASSVLRNNKLDPGLAEGLVTNYHTPLDPVTYGERLTPTGGALGTQITIPATGLFTSGHSMDSVLADLQAWH